MQADSPPGAGLEPVPGPAQEQGPLVFPTEFPIKIMGFNRLEFEPQMLEIVRGHAPDLDLNRVEVRQSRGGKYLSITVTVLARSRAQLDAIYLDLTAHPLVKVVL